jgi:hypothetical protein
MRLWNAMDQSFKSETAKVIGHLGRAVGPVQERFDVGPKIPVMEAPRQMREAVTACSTAITRGSPNRRAEARWPPSSVGCWSRSSASWVNTH